VIVAKSAKLDVQTMAELKRLRELERQYQVLKEEHELLKKSHPVCFGSKAEAFEFIEANRTEHKVALMCRVYGVTRAGFYAWCSRERSEREHQNAQLARNIRVVHRDSRGTYGSPRVYQVLRKAGCRVSENRVARVMRTHGIKARVATIRYTNPTLQRFYSATRNQQLEVDLRTLDQVWVGDITYLKIGSIIPIYNGTRLHSSLNYVPPATYETPSMTNRCQQNRGKIPRVKRRALVFCP
jgi:hypothetical protein